MSKHEKSFCRAIIKIKRPKLKNLSKFKMGRIKNYFFHFLILFLKLLPVWFLKNFAHFSGFLKLYLELSLKLYFLKLYSF